MRTPPAWLEPAFVGALLIVGMLVVMWASSPDATCSLPADVPRRLVLSRETDREHLSTDLASAGRAARRHMRSTGEAAEPDTRFTDCEAMLVRAIADRHGLTVDQVRGSGLGAP
jgi:hypothetical protein